MRRATCFACLAAMVVVAGCAQSDSALELANKTNAVALSVKFQIEDFATTQRRVAEIETDRLGRFLEDTIEIETELAEVIPDSPSDQASLFSATPTRADEIVAAEAQAAKDAAELRKDLLELLQEFTPPSDDIEALSVQLTVLGAEKSFSENIAFFVSFGTSVKEAIDKAKAERDQALKKAAGGP